MIQSQPFSNSLKTIPRRRFCSQRKRQALITMLTVFAVAGAFPTRAQNGNRDHLSPQESDIVRDTRELDNRIDVLIKMAERRFAVINGTPDPVAKGATATKSKKKKDEDEIDWGDP